VLSGRARCLLDDGTAGGDVYRSGRVWAAIWKAGKVTLRGIGDDRLSVCAGVNLDGTAAGYCVPADQNEVSSGDPEERGNRKAYLWKAGRHTMFPGLGGLVSECTAINESGTVVGWADTKDGSRAFQWDPGKISVLPATEGANYCEANSINNHGVIVGDCRASANVSSACIWRKSGVEDLNKLIPVNSGWKLIEVTHISDNGLIVGCGIHSNDPKDGMHAFLLTPVSSGIH
jgi:probable HAF family extracellular repeat protein